MHGDQHTALKHILKETHSLQAHGLTAGIRSGDNQDALLGVQFDIQWYYLLVVLGERKLQQRVDGCSPIQDLFVFKRRLDGLDVNGKVSLGTDEVYLGQEFVGLEDSRYLRTYGSREFRQDADNLSTFFAFQLTDTVVRFHHFGRFDEHGLTSSRFVVYDTLDLSFQAGCYRNNQTTIAHGWGNILVYIAICLCIAKNGMKATRDASGGRCQFPADAQQLG